MKNYLVSILKAIVSLTIVNVWLFRYSRESVYRGGDSKDLITEFAAYGLSLPIMYLIGALKVIAALALLGSVFSKIKAQIPLLVIAALMTAAIYFHFSIGDPLMKSFPAAFMLSLCILIFFLQKNPVRQ